MMGDEDNVAGRDIAENRRFGIAPSLVFGLGTPTRLTLQLLPSERGRHSRLRHSLAVQRSGARAIATTTTVSRTATFSAPTTTSERPRLEHDVNSHVTIRNQVRYANYVRDVQITEPQVLNPVAIALRSVRSPSIAIRSASNSVETYLDDQLDVTSATSRPVHLQHDARDRRRRRGAKHRTPRVPNTQTFRRRACSNPDPDSDRSRESPHHRRNVTHNLAQRPQHTLLDTIEARPEMGLTGGFRWDRFDTDYSAIRRPGVRVFARR